MADEFCAGDGGRGAAPGFGGRLEVLEGPSGRRRWSDALKGRIVAESFAAGARVCDVARRYRVAGQQLTTWRRAARDGLLALPGEAVGADDLGLVSVEVEAPVEASAESVPGEVGKRDEAPPTPGRDDRRREDRRVGEEGVMRGRS